MHDSFINNKVEYADPQGKGTDSEAERSRKEGKKSLNGVRTCVCVCIFSAEEGRRGHRHRIKPKRENMLSGVVVPLPKGSS